MTTIMKFPNINLQNEEMMQLGKAYCSKNGEKLGIMKYQLWKNHYEVQGKIEELFDESKKAFSDFFYH